MVMNYDTYLEIDQDSDSGFPGKPVWTHKERRHYGVMMKKILRKKSDWQLIGRQKKSSNMNGKLVMALHNDEAIAG